MDKFYTVNDIAQMTQLSTRTIRRYLSSGTLNGQKIGRQWRFTEADLATFLDNQQVLDLLDEQIAQDKQAFASGKVHVEPAHPQAEVTLIQAFTNGSDLQAEKERLLTAYNQLPPTTDFTLRLRVLPDHRLRLVLFGDWHQLNTFTQNLALAQ